MPASLARTCCDHGAGMNASKERSCWRAAPGWMKGLLAASLAVNLVVAGLVGGNALRHWSDGDRFHKVEIEPGLDRRQSRILRMVPEAQQDEAKRILLDRQDELDRARAEMREANMAFIDAIRAEPFDTERLEQALARRHAAARDFWRIGAEQVAEIARALDAPARAELAERLEERTRRWMKRWDRDEE